MEEMRLKYRSYSVGLGDAFQLPNEDLTSAMRVFRASEASGVRRMRGGAAPDHHGYLARVKVELLAPTYSVAGCTARKSVLEGGQVQKRLFDIGWSNENKCQACHKEEGTEKHRLYHLSGLEGSQAPNPKGLQKVGTKSEDIKEGMEVAKRHCDA